jgi:hypothetical protein
MRGVSCVEDVSDFSIRTLLQGVIHTLKSGNSVHIILADDLGTECGVDAYGMTLSEKGKTSYQRIEQLLYFRCM